MKKKSLNHLFFFIFLSSLINISKAIEKINPLGLEKIELKKENTVIGISIPETLPLFHFDFSSETLTTLLNQMAATLGINLILPQGADEIKQKISFHPIKNPITYKESIRLIETFLDFSGYALTRKSEKLFAVIKIKEKNLLNENFPLFINTRPEDLPFSDSPIRAVFYLSNLKVDNDSLKKILGDMLSSEKSCIFDTKTNSIIVTDKSNLIASAMKVVLELDSMGTQNHIIIVQLHNSNAEKLIEIIKKQIIGITPNQPHFLFNEPKTESAVLFPKSLRLAAEPRTNSIIIMGKPSAVERMKEFIQDVLDAPLEHGASILHYYELEYVNAVELEEVVRSVFTQSSTDQSSQQSASEMFRGVKIFAERPTEKKADTAIGGGLNYNSSGSNSIVRGGNRLFVAALEDDWKRIEKFLKEIDKPLDQVILEVLLIDIQVDKTKALGSQVRSINNDRFGPFAGTWQSAQLAPPINPIAPPIYPPLEPDLLSLKTPTETSLAAQLSSGNPGSLIIQASDLKGSTSGVLRILDSLSNYKILSHPFLITSNNQTAELKDVEVRRGAADANIVGSGGAINIAQTDIKAELSIFMTPRVSAKDRINLNLEIKSEKFTSSAGNGSNQSLTTLKRIVNTNSNIRSGDILILGGFTREVINTSTYEWPVLSKIPVIGWLFKSTSQITQISNLAIFICPTVLKVERSEGLDKFTEDKFNQARDRVIYNEENYERDPINRIFFSKSNFDKNMLNKKIKSSSQIDIENKKMALEKEQLESLNKLKKQLAFEENPLIKKKQQKKESANKLKSK
jgi:general secretion pathway protein D